MFSAHDDVTSIVNIFLNWAMTRRCKNNQLNGFYFFYKFNYNLLKMTEAVLWRMRKSYRKVLISTKNTLKIILYKKKTMYIIHYVLCCNVKNTKFDYATLRLTRPFRFSTIISILRKLLFFIYVMKTSIVFKVCNRRTYSIVIIQKYCN